MDYLYSIIVPIFGVEAFLEECIISIIGQSYSNIEIILVDDGSLDHCPSICDEYAKKDSRVKVIHKENGGLVSARKAGAMIATGDYICCVDGDDYIASEYISVINQIANQYNPDIICLGHYMARETGNQVFEDKTIAGFYEKERIETEIFPWLIHTPRGYYFPASIWGKAIRKELYIDAQMRVDPHIKMGEDAACSMICMKNAESLYILKEPLYYYRISNSSMSKNGKPMSWESAEYLSKHIMEALGRRDSLFQEQVYRFICHHFFNVSTSQFKRSESYNTIKNEICEEMKKPVFYEAINKAEFLAFSKGKAIHICLRHKLISILFLYSKIHR